MELKDFSQKRGLSFADYDAPSLVNNFKVDPSSYSMIAATESLTSEQEPSVDSFRELRDSLLSPEGRRNFTLQQSMKRKQITDNMASVLPSILVDDTLTDEEKSQYLVGVQQAPGFFHMENSKLLAESAAATVVPGESEEEAESRLSYIDLIDEVHKSKRDSALAIQAWQTAKDEGTMAKVGEFFEILAPFAEWANVNQLRKAMTGEGGEAILPGSVREELVESMRAMPYNERAQLTQKLIEIVDAKGGLILTDNNDLISVGILEDILTNNDYSNEEKWVDNMFGVLDLIGVGAVLRSAAKPFSAARKMSVVNQTNPVSPGMVVKDANGDVARGMEDMAAQTDEAAEALYGASKEEAVAKAELPEPEYEPGKVENKADTRVPEYEEPAEITAARTRQGDTGVSDSELATARREREASLLQVEGMTPRREMIQIVENKDGSTTFRMMYTPKDSGFRTADRALANAKYAFRHFELEDGDFTLYYRNGDEWVETTEKELAARKALRDEYTRKKKKIPPELKEIDYAVGVNYTYKFDPSQLSVDKLLTKTQRILGIPLNFLDRLPAGLARLGQGSLTQHLLPANFLLNKRIVSAAAVGHDKAIALRSLYVDAFKPFIKGYKKLPKDRRQLMAEYIHEANFNGLRLDTTDLQQRGFSESEIALLREWRRGNDILWHASNADLARSQKAKGFKIYTDENDSRFVVKPAKRGAVSTRTEIYDPIEDRIRRFATTEEIDEFYESGGVVAKTEQPIKIGDDYVDSIMVRETPEGGYLREIRENEVMLNYRDGYYPVMYDAPFFIDKIITLKDGTKATKTIATSRNREDALHVVEQLRATDPEAEFVARTDRRLEAKGDPDYSIAVSSGMSNQKVRGQRLLDADVDLHNAGNSNLHDPLEAVSNQIRRLSERVSMRQYLETTKKRWVDTFAEDLGLERNKFGEYSFPTDISQIQGKGLVDPQTLADARSLFNYVHHLENGYINLIDEGFKAILSVAADQLASMGLKGLESRIRPGGPGSITSTAKSLAFKLYLAANPARQLIIQAHQNVQLMAINPKYMVSPNGIAWDLHRVNLARRGLTNDKEALEMWEELKYSGMMEAVDANNLVRNDMLRLANLTTGQKLASAAGTPLTIAQRVGFDTAEQSVLVMSWLTHRDMAVQRLGKRTFTRREYEEIAGDARAFTYNMNRGGDMPYNQNSFNIIAQFLQVPHKAILQPFLDRNLTAQQKLRLMTFNTVMYGVPPGIMYHLYEEMEDGPVRDMLEKGLEHQMLNLVLTQATGKKQAIDWGDLAPNNIHGFGDAITGIWTTGIGHTVANSPSASLLFGNNPRLLNLFKTAAQYLYPPANYEDPELKVRFPDVVRTSLSLFSGMNNTFKAIYALETGQKMSSMGTITDSDVTKVEAAMQFFGFMTEEEKGKFKAQEILFANTDIATDDNVSNFYNQLKRVLAMRGTSVEEDEVYRLALAEAYRVFQYDEVKFREKFQRMINSDVRGGDLSLFKHLQGKIGFIDDKQMRFIIEQLADGPMKENLLLQLDSAQQAASEARQ